MGSKSLAVEWLVHQEKGAQSGFLWRHVSVKSARKLFLFFLVLNCFFLMLVAGQVGRYWDLIFYNIMNFIKYKLLAWLKLIFN